MVYEIRVSRREDLPDPLGESLLAEVHRMGIPSVSGIRTIKIYRFDGLDQKTADWFGGRLIDIDQRLVAATPRNGRFVEVSYKPGVMNPEVASLIKMARDLGVPHLICDTSMEYHFAGTYTPEELGAVVDRLLVNKTVQRLVTETPTTLSFAGVPGTIRTVPILAATDEELMALSKDKLFLNLAEMRAAKAEAIRLGRDFRDGELESIAQVWSEHCSHKTFNKKIRVGDILKPSLMSRLRDASLRYADDTVSIFVDNSGVVLFYDGYAICIKVETHNSPSAIEPYGGAATGVGGVLRDIMGTGQGAKVILSTDVFCFARPSLPLELLPPGCLHPEYLLRRVVNGVRDYGNQMGVPTANGSVHFHDDFRAKPSVIVGAVGIMPADRAQKGEPKSGDVIITIGGRTGRDGIHGATFSSAEMTERTVTVNSSAVQIGNAIEERRMSEAILHLRDMGLIRAITDCGAGGFSSAIGEMGKDTGVHVELERAPLKYAGLSPWEIWLSESQERMVLAVRPEDVNDVLRVCGENYNVEATVLGRFTETKQLLVTYNGETLCDLSMEFLHDGCPMDTLEAHWEPSVFPEPVLPAEDGATALQCLHDVLAHLDVCSKEPIVRQYDHGVQGTSALPPFSGEWNDGPNDATVLRPLLDRPYGVVVGHGVNPVLNRIDPYWGAVSAGVEAIANIVATGANPSAIWLVDNFIWPFPDREALGALDQAVDGCCLLVEAFKAPFISGKDSLSGTYRGGNSIIKIPPVLNITAMGKISNVRETASADLKRAGSRIFLVGAPDLEALGGSTFYDTLGAVGNTIAKPDLVSLPNVFTRVHEWIKDGRALAVHDVSEGGIVTSLAEMCFGGHLGAQLWLDEIGRGSIYAQLFNQTPGCLLVEISASDREIQHELPPELMREIGCTIQAPILSAYVGPRRNCLFWAELSELKNSWQKPMREIFP